MSAFFLKKNSLYHIFYYFLLFIGLFVFFSQVHPLMPFDTDEIIQKIKEVTKEDIVEVANKIEPKLEYYLGN